MNVHLVITAIGLAAAGLTFASDLMKNMLPLRLVALAGNVLFIGYYFMTAEWPHLVLHAFLLPVNAKRLWDIQRLVRELKKVDDTTPLSEWLVPHMKRRAFKAGEVLFRQGDIATELIYIGSGSVRLLQNGALLGTGSLIGEIGLFSPDRRRTQTVVCETDGTLYRMTDAMLYKLYFLNPKLAFHLIRLIVQRLLADVRKATPALEPVA